VSVFLQQLANGLAAGSIYALIAVGYSLVYGVLELINFAHGDVFMFATFAAVALLLAGLPLPLVVILALLIGAGLGLVIERVAYRPLRSANRIAPTITAVGAALILENAAVLIWGPQTRPFPTPVPQGLFQVFGATVSVLQVAILAVAGAMALVVYLVVQHTAWGLAMRAIRDDAATAELIGIPVNRTIATVYAFGSILGVIAGLLYAIYYNAVFVGMGFSGTMNAFVAAVIGGIGSLQGAFVGGLLLGVLQALAVGYIASGFENSVAFLFMIVVLVVRPYGLFGTPRASRI
jgi:branched-chain amino acid transport system permease protein